MSENQEELKKKTIKGFFWRFGERVASQAVSFIVSIVLARLLEPSEYGVVALTMVFMAIASCLTISGLGSSLIQKKDADDLDFSTMFHAGMVLSIMMYVMLYLTAPIVGNLYQNKQVTSVLRVLGLMLPISSVQSIQQARVSRQLDFKKFFYATFAGTVISGIIGIAMAYSGMGVWALVFQQISNVAVNTLILSIVVNWCPRWQFSWLRFKQLFAFGVKLMGAQLLGTTFNELKSLVIGVKYLASDLAYFNRGDSIPSMLSYNINNTINAVLYPAISKIQDDKIGVKKAVRRSVMTSTFFMMPVMMLIAASADNIVLVLLTEKWLPCVPYMQVLCLSHGISVIGTANLQAFNAVGRSDITLKLEFVKKPLFLFTLFLTMQVSPLAIAIGMFIYTVISTAINAWPNKKLINYGYLEQLWDVLPQLLASIIIAIFAYLIGKVSCNIYILVMIQLLSGAALYFLITRYLSFESYHYIINSLKGLLKNN